MTVHARPTDSEGRTAVRAVVHARLLGIRLLTLDAQILLGPADATPSAGEVVHPVDEVGAGRRAVAVGYRPSVRGPRPAGLDEASDLLDESATSLARIRRSSVRSA